jgi:O-antigen chain-terminating methyltransferase
VLRPDGILLLETINPATLTALRNYFADLTHAQPLVPETLKFLVERAGFRQARIEYQNTSPEIGRLHHVPYGDRVTEAVQAESDRNVDLVNAMLFGPQDYAVIAQA